MKTVAIDLASILIQSPYSPNAMRIYRNLIPTYDNLSRHRSCILLYPRSLSLRALFRLASAVACALERRLLGTTCSSSSLASYSSSSSSVSRAKSTRSRRTRKPNSVTRRYRSSSSLRHAARTRVLDFVGRSDSAFVRIAQSRRNDGYDDLGPRTLRYQINKFPCKLKTCYLFGVKV